MNLAVADNLVQTPAQQQVPESCVNCGEVVQGKFCSSCGQRMLVKRISWKSLIQEFTAKWLGFDNQFWRTFLNLTVQPGKLMRSYLAGNRITYLGPLGYYFIVTALVFLGFAMLEISIEEFMVNSSSNLGPTNPQNSKALKFQQEMLHYMSSALRFMVILFVPFFAWAAKLLYRKKGLNFLEFCILLLYSSAHMFWLTLLQGIMYKITGQVYAAASVFISILYYGFFYQDVLEQKKSVVGFFKGVLAYILGFLVMMSAMMVVMIILIVLRVKLGFN